MSNTKWIYILGTGKHQNVTLLLIILKFYSKILLFWSGKQYKTSASVKRKMGIDFPRVDTADIGRLLLRLRDEIEGTKSALNSGSGNYEIIIW